MEQQNPLTSQQRSRILVIEDEADIAELIHYNLKKEGFAISVASDGQRGLEQARSQGADLILLDIMLPELDGFSVCHQLRQDPRTEAIPIIILTAKGEESDTVHGLDLGADDYMIKPFRASELVARIKAHLRRYALYRKMMNEGPPDADTLKHLGPLALDRSRHIIFLKGKPLILTLSEFKLLSTLMSAPGQVFTRSQLIHHIAGKGVHLVERNVDVHILALRKKLGGHSSLIQTIRGVGYKCRD